jgi:hypothetical protein
MLGGVNGSGARRARASVAPFSAWDGFREAFSRRDLTPKEGPRAVGVFWTSGIHRLPLGEGHSASTVLFKASAEHL